MNRNMNSCTASRFIVLASFGNSPPCALRAPMGSAPRAKPAGPPVVLLEIRPRARFALRWARPREQSPRGPSSSSWKFAPVRASRSDGLGPTSKARADLLVPFLTSLRVRAAHDHSSGFRSVHSSKRRRGRSRAGRTRLRRCGRRPKTALMPHRFAFVMDPIERILPTRTPPSSSCSSRRRAGTRSTYLGIDDLFVARVAGLRPGAARRGDAARRRSAHYRLFEERIDAAHLVRRRLHAQGPAVRHDYFFATQMLGARRPAADLRHQRSARPARGEREALRAALPDGDPAEHGHRRHAAPEDVPRRARRRDDRQAARRLRRRRRVPPAAAAIATSTPSSRCSTDNGRAR